MTDSEHQELRGISSTPVIVGVREMTRSPTYRARSTGIRPAPWTR